MPGAAIPLKDGRVVRLRAGVPEDGEALLELHHASILALGQGFYTKAELDDWASGLTPEGYGRAMQEEAFLVAEARDGSLAGFASFKADEVVGFYVHPDWARCGLGTVLLQRAETAIIDDGHANLRISASLSGLPFYLARGYRVIQQRLYKTRGGLEVAIVDLEKPASP